MNKRLVDGDNLTLYGIWNVDPDSIFIKYADSVINYIKNKIITTDTSRFETEEISKSINISEHYVSSVFELINHYGNFWSSAGRSNNVNFGYSYIDVGGDSAIDTFSFI